MKTKKYIDVDNLLSLLRIECDFEQEMGFYIAYATTKRLIKLIEAQPPFIFDSKFDIEKEKK